MDFLNNTEIVVGIGFVIFVGILIYFGVPGMITPIARRPRRPHQAGAR